MNRTSRRLYNRRGAYHSTLRTINVLIGEINGGFGLNWQYPDLDPETFREFLREMKREAGFRHPDLIRLANNNAEGSGPDWSRLRFRADDCALSGVEPSNAAYNVGRWLESAHVREKYGIHFNVSISDPDPSYV